MRITIKLMLILAVVSTPAYAANLFVPNQFSTIQAAVDASSPGDRILVDAGVYDGAVIATRVKIIGEGDQTVITHGPNNRGGTSQWWFQNGFQIVSGGDGSIIRDLKIELDAGLVDPMGFELIQVGIFAVTVDRVSVRGVTFTGLNTGVDFRNSHKWSITQNTIEGLNATLTRRAIGVRLVGSDSMVGFNTITHDGSLDDNSAKRYRGIEIICVGCNIPVENNKLIQNEIAIDVPGALELSDIRLLDFSALLGGDVEIFNNKIIQNDADPIVLIPPLLIDHNVVK